MAFPHNPEVDFSDDDSFDASIEHLLGLLEPDLPYLVIKSGKQPGTEHELGDRLYRWIGAWMEANKIELIVSPAFTEYQEACLLGFADLARFGASHAWGSKRTERLELLTRVQLKIAPVQNEIRLRFEI